MQRSSVISPVTGVLHDANTGDDVGVTQSHLPAWGESEKLFGRIFFEIVLIDIQDAGRELTRACGRIFRIVDGIELLDLSLGIIFDHEAQGRRTAMTRGARLFQVFADKVFEELHFDDGIPLRDADCFAKCAQSFRREPAAAQSFERRQAWIVPSVDQLALDEIEQFALAHDRKGHIQPGKFDLLRPLRRLALSHDPVIQWPVVFKFQGADRMGDTFDRVRTADARNHMRVNGARSCRCGNERHAGCGRAPDRGD